MIGQRQRSPAPPQPPPKDAKDESVYSSSTSTHPSILPSTNYDTRYVNDNLAEAVKDSVHIGTTSKLAPPVSLSRDQTDSVSRLYSDPQPSQAAHSRWTPSSNPSGNTFQPTHGYSQSSPDMSSITQPQLPSQRMQGQNPFEQDEIEPNGTGRLRASGALGISEAGGAVPPSRGKITRATTG